jgi:hypothetical protein
VKGETLSAKFDYYAALMDLLRKPSPSKAAMRNAVLEHMVLGTPQAEAAERHQVAQPNLARLVKRIRELEAGVLRVCELRNRMQE